MIIDVYGQGNKMYCCYEFYKPVDKPEGWLACPNCQLKPLIWTFNNGRHTACGCGESRCNHFSISAESIMSCLDNKTKYDCDGLRKNWNEWCESGSINFETVINNGKVERW